MLNVNLRLLNRQSFFLLCSGMFLVMSAEAVRAEPDESPVRQAHAESEPVRHSVFGDIVQIAGKHLAKSANEPKPPLDLDAKGSSDSASRKTAIATMPLDQLSPENRQKVGGLLKS